MNKHEAYLMCKKKILEARKRLGFDYDFEASLFWSGYVTGVRDMGFLTKLQVRKLDDLKRVDMTYANES